MTRTEFDQINPGKENSISLQSINGALNCMSLIYSRTIDDWHRLGYLFLMSFLSSIEMSRISLVRGEKSWTRFWYDLFIFSLIIDPMINWRDLFPEEKEYLIDFCLDSFIFDGTFSFYNQIRMMILVQNKYELISLENHSLWISSLNIWTISSEMLT